MKSATRIWTLQFLWAFLGGLPFLLLPRFILETTTGRPANAAQHDRVGRGDRLKPGREVGGRPDRERLAPISGTDLADHGGAGVDPDPHCEVDRFTGRDLRPEHRDLPDDLERGPDRVLRVVLVRNRVTEVGQRILRVR